MASENAIAEIKDYFAGLDQSYYLQRINKFDQHWTKFIGLRGDYVEK